jgi:flavin-binding protein dodecin
MPAKTFKLIEVVGVSEESIQQAVRNALNKARRTIRNIDWFEVAGIRGYVRPNGDPEFQVQVKIGFRLDDQPVVDDLTEARKARAKVGPRGRAPVRTGRRGRSLG